jgi:hypothetical protein
MTMMVEADPPPDNKIDPPITLMRLGCGISRSMACWPGVMKGSVAEGSTDNRLGAELSSFSTSVWELTTKLGSGLHLLSEVIPYHHICTARFVFL